MKATIHLCTYTTNAKGGKLLTTKYSHWDAINFKNKDQARVYAHGIVCGLRYKWNKAAVALDFEDGQTEYFTDSELK